MRLITIMVIMFLIIIAAAVTSYYTIQSLANNITDILDDLEKNIINENWSNVETIFDNIKNEWEKSEMIVTLFIDHADLRDLNISLSKISTLIEMQDKQELLPEIAVFRDLVNSIPEEERLSLRNVF